jgi:hypothetical protein
VPVLVSTCIGGDTIRLPFSSLLSAALFFVRVLPIIPRPMDEQVLFLSLIESAGEATPEPAITTTPHADGNTHSDEYGDSNINCDKHPIANSDAHCWRKYPMPPGWNGGNLRLDLRSRTILAVYPHRGWPLSCQR